MARCVTGQCQGLSSTLQICQDSSTRCFSCHSFCELSLNLTLLVFDNLLPQSKNQSYIFTTSHFHDFSHEKPSISATYTQFCCFVNRCRKLVTPFQFASQTCETFEVTTDLYSVTDAKHFNSVNPSHPLQ